jgi:hypothetical protein
VKTVKTLKNTEKYRKKKEKIQYELGYLALAD